MPAQPSNMDLLRVLVGKDIPRSGTATAGTLATNTILADGEVVVTDLGLVILDTTTVVDKKEVFLVQGRGSAKSLLMVKVDIDTVKSYKGKAYAPKVEQVSYIGYNAVTNVGSFDVINDNYYQLNLYMNEQVPSSMAGLYIPITADYTSDASATQEEISNGLYKSLVTQLLFWKQKQIYAERVNSGASSGTTDAGIVVSIGDQQFTLPNISGAAAVGDYLRFGAGDISPVYKITAIAGTLVTIDRPVQSVTGTITMEHIVLATANAGNYGFKLTGVPRAFQLDVRPYDQATFQASLVDFGSTTFTTAIFPFIGHGTYEQIATIEDSSWGNIGQIFYHREMIPYNRESDAVSTQNYSTLDIRWTKLVGETTNSRFSGTVAVALPLDGNVANTFDTNIRGGVTSLMNVLDSWITNNTTLTAQAFTI